ncbi:MAG: hypothetical protein QOD42_3736 [Sphingomonadales bacterium]|jgi:hypothetical protein|nr:hypothetical protein [Sphingomonadales bacterium]
MKRPPASRWFLGQPIVATAVVALGCYGLYRWYLDAELWFVGIAALGGIVAAGNASKEVRQYTQWMREWEALGPNAEAAKAPAHPALKRAALAAMLVPVIFYLYTNRDVPEHRIALICIGASLALLVVSMLVDMLRWARRGIRRRQAAATQPVAICVRRPVLPVPDLQRAYEALPDHCWRTINGGSR